MWKCINRGLRTSSKLLKTDQSNGGCIVSSVLSKDFEELATQPKTSLNLSTRVDDGILRAASNSKNNVDGNQDSGENFSKLEAEIGVISVEVPKDSFIATDLHSNSTTCKADVSILKCEDATNVDLVCCRRCHEVYENAPNCLCCSKIRSQSWLPRKLHLHYPYNHNSSISITCRGYLNHSALRRPDHLDLAESKTPPDNSETSRKTDSLVKIQDPSLITSFLQPYYTQRKGRSDLERKKSGTEKSQICHDFTSCLLKLPFLSFDFMRNKGLNQLHECLQNKAKIESGKDGEKGQKRDRNGDSEEARKESWRRHQLQQSLLEAIGFSSAILLGWFLVQYRIWHPCKERHHAENQRRAHGARCGMFSRLLFSRTKNPHQPLNAVPSNPLESNDKPITVEKCSSKDSNTVSVERGNDSSSDAYMDDLQERCISSNIASKLTNQGISTAAEGNQRQIKVHSVPVDEVKKEEPIPMPWYPQDSKQFGPITLEQAMDEAGKSLEEVHAEVLLQLALEKLEFGEEIDCESSAVDLLTEAAHLGSSVAAFNLGICYETGVGGVKKSLSQAYYWYKIASDKGHAAAMYNMAIYHAQGLAGLTVDTKLARQLLERASSFELPEARDALMLLTSLEPTENGVTPQDDYVMSHNHSIAKSSSKLSLIEEESGASYRNDSDYIAIPKEDKSHHGTPKNLGKLGLSHLIAESLLPSFIDEDDVSSEVVLDNTQSAKQSYSKYASAIAIAN